LEYVEHTIVAIGGWPGILILVEEQDEHPGGSDAGVAKEHVLAELSIGGSRSDAGLLCSPTSSSQSQSTIPEVSKSVAATDIYILDELVLYVLLIVYDDLVREGAPIWPLVALTSWPLDI
jgi:hypothetical protein